MPDVITVGKLKARLLAESDAGKPAYVVAALCGIHPSELSRFASGDSISQKHLLRLAEYFGCDANDLIGTYDVDVG